MVTRRQLNWSLLSSGSFLITAESEFPPCFQIGFLFPAGSADEAVGLEGLSQIALPLLGRETLRHSRTELQRNLDRLGAIVDSDTMEETSIVTMVFMEDHVDECLSLLREILTEPTVQKRDLAREKRKLRANFQILDQDPDVVTEAHARTAYFGPGHPLSQQARPKTVGRIKDRKSGV